MYPSRVIWEDPFWPAWQPQRCQEKIQILESAHVYWSRIDTDILNYVKICTICTRFRMTQAVQLMIPRDIPDRPWQELAKDFHPQW